MDSDSKTQAENVAARARLIKLVLMDCDGVLTDGRLWLTSDGEEQKTFDVRDGQGIALLHVAGLKSGIISGRTSAALERRAQELGVSIVRQGVSNKVAEFEMIIAEVSLRADECAFIGDDLADIPVMSRAGLAIAVADSVAETLQAAHYVTTSNGGNGAVRESCELILKAQGRWEELMKRYTDD